MVLCLNAVEKATAIDRKGSASAGNPGVVQTVSVIEERVVIAVTASRVEQEKVEEEEDDDDDEK